MDKNFESLGDVLEDERPAVKERAVDEAPAPRTAVETTALLATVGAIGATLAACGGGTESAAAAAGSASQVASNGTLAQATASSKTGVDAAGSTSATTGAASISRVEFIAEIVRFLLQAQFSAPDADINTIRTQSYDAWLTQQFNAPMSQTGYDWLVANGHTDPFQNQFFSAYPGDRMIWQQLIASPDQMRKRLALALSEMFVVNLGAFDAFWPGSFTGAFWDVLVKNAFGNFRQLLEDVTLNPAMGRYLNTLGNLKEDPATGRQPDENYAREVMQLFTIGLYELNLDGTPKLDAAGKPIDTYKQIDVSNLARVFTGYEYDERRVTGTQTPFQPYKIPSPEYAQDPMYVKDPSRHSNLSATFLGTTVPANTSAAAALKIALDRLFNHPNAAPFFAKQMIQRLVTSNPSPAYVQRVASVFNNNGAGVRGDMKAFWKALLLDVEARTLPTSPNAGRVREPMVRAVQWARTFSATSVSGQWNIGDQSSSQYAISQNPLRSASVFNFFRPGYVPPGTSIAAAGLVAPEFQIHNESSTVSYLNYLSIWSEIGFGESYPNNDLKANYTALLPLATNAADLVAWVSMRLSANQLSDKTFKAIYQSVNSLPISAGNANADKLNRIYATVLLVMACPEYIIQK